MEGFLGKIGLELGKSFLFTGLLPAAIVMIGWSVYFWETEALGRVLDLLTLDRLGGAV